jgi:nucleoid-associated protein YgaU
MLKEKYQSVLDLAEIRGVKLLSVTEEGGKLKVKGTSSYQMDKNLVWDKIKTMTDWKTEVAVDITVENKEIFGVYTVQPGDTLSKISKDFLGSPNRSAEIFNLNKEALTDPHTIRPGQALKIPIR